MKERKRPGWKRKRRIGFHLYFTVFMSVVIVVSVAVAAFVSSFLDDWLQRGVNVPVVIPLIILSLAVGLVLSFFVGKVMLSPIKTLRRAMNEVAEGNLNISIPEESKVDEVEDICHAFNIMMRELRSTEVMQTDFISNVSHEFKTPLTAIEGYATLLQDENVSEEERAEYTEKILLNAHRMSELVGNILLLSKLDNQAIESRNSRFDLAEQIRQAIVLSEPKWTEKDLEFDVNLEKIAYEGNEGLMTHVWNNLIGNAIKFSPIGGKISLVLKRWNGYVYFSVSDEGEGIKEESKQYIFDKFYQSDTSHKQEGNGLGLALVKKILDVCSGEIGVENLKPCGCKFTVRLPGNGE